MGANPATWFAVGALFLLIVVRFGLDRTKEVNMNTSTNCRMAKVKSVTKSVFSAAVETFWALATNILAGLVTASIHAKGAPRKS